MDLEKEKGKRLEYRKLFDNCAWNCLWFRVMVVTGLWELLGICLAGSHHENVPDDGAGWV